MDTLSQWIEEFEAFCGGDKLNELRRMHNAWKLGLLDDDKLEASVSLIGGTHLTVADNVHNILRNLSQEFLRTLSFSKYEPVIEKNTIFPATRENLQKAIWGSYGPQLAYLQQLEAMTVCILTYLATSSMSYRLSICHVYWVELLQQVGNALEIPNWYTANLDDVWAQIKTNYNIYQFVGEIAHLLRLFQFDTVIPILDKIEPPINEDSKRIYRTFWARMENLYVKMEKQPFEEAGCAVYQYMTNYVQELTRQLQVTDPDIEVLQGGVEEIRGFNQPIRRIPEIPQSEKTCHFNFSLLFQDVCNILQKIRAKRPASRLQTSTQEVTRKAPKEAAREATRKTPKEAARDAPNSGGRKSRCKSLNLPNWVCKILVASIATGFGGVASYAFVKHYAPGLSEWAAQQLNNDPGTYLQNALDVMRQLFHLEEEQIDQVRTDSNSPYKIPFVNASSLAQQGVNTAVGKHIFCNNTILPNLNNTQFVLDNNLQTSAHAPIQAKEDYCLNVSPTLFEKTNTFIALLKEGQDAQKSLETVLKDDVECSIVHADLVPLFTEHAVMGENVILPFELKQNYALCVLRPFGPEWSVVGTEKLQKIEAERVTWREEQGSDAPIEDLKARLCTNSSFTDLFGCVE